MNYIVLEIIKGFFVGIGMVAPGLSGGLFAVALGIYPRIMKGISQLTRHPIQVIRDLFWIGIGGILGLIMTFFVILQFIEWFPLPFSLLFIGFILGSIPSISLKVKNDVQPFIKIFFFCLFFLLIILVPFVPQIDNGISQLNGSSISILILVGFILAGTLIIPGISGSLVLMALGFYTYLFQTVRDFSDGIFHLDFNLIGNAFVPLMLMMAGLILGLLVFAKSIHFLLEHYQSILYASVLGLLTASPFSIGWQVFSEYPNLLDHLWINIPLGVLCLFLGVVLAKKMSMMESKEKRT